MLILILTAWLKAKKKSWRTQTNMRQQSKSNSSLSGSVPDLQPFISQSSYRWLKACRTFTTVRPLARPCSLLLSSASTANIQFSSHLCHEVHRGCWTQTHWLQARLGFPLLLWSLFPPFHFRIWKLCWKVLFFFNHSIQFICNVSSILECIIKTANQRHLDHTGLFH